MLMPRLSNDAIGDLPAIADQFRPEILRFPWGSDVILERVMGLIHIISPYRSRKGEDVPNLRPDPKSSVYT